MLKYILDERQLLDVVNVARGVFWPVLSFLDRKNYAEVIEQFRVSSGEFFPFPIGFPLGGDPQSPACRSPDKIWLYWNETRVGCLNVTEVFAVDMERVTFLLFGTSDPNHPGVTAFARSGSRLAAGTVTLDDGFIERNARFSEAPAAIRKAISERGWKTVLGFATRNVPHRGHEYLLTRYGSRFDGVLIQPTIAPRERGHYAQEAIRSSFEHFIANHPDPGRYLLHMLPATSLKGGPREALLQAVMRRNFGCTHFVIGRDHSGVKDYYPKYAAQLLAEKYARQLGISIVKPREPYFCRICGDIVSDDVCAHSETHPEAIKYISSSQIRSTQERGQPVDPDIFNPTITQILPEASIYS